MSIERVLKYGPLIILVIGLVSTTLIWIGLSYVENNNAKAEFNVETNKIHRLIIERLSLHEELLTGVNAFFMASKEVTLQEWKIYLDELEFQEKFPGIQGIGYSQYIKSDKELDELKNRLQKYGIDDYTIKPEGIRDEYFPVVFLEPIDYRNENAIGYDIYSEKIRRSAVENVKNTESTSITGKIILVQEVDQDIQNGFLMLKPSFTNEKIGNQDAVKELDGIVSAVFRMDDFIFELIEPEVFNNIHMKIYDQKLSEENIFFDSLKDGKTESFPNRFFNSAVINLYERDWIITLEGQPTGHFLTLFYGQSSQIINIFILIIGYAFSGLGFYSIHSFQTNARVKKEEKLTNTLLLKNDMDIIRRQEDSLLRFKEKSENVVVCIIDIENSTKITSKISDHASAKLYSTFHNFMSKIIVAHRGIVVKSMGDAILFYFKTSYPPSKNDCMLAVDCCLDLIESNEELNNNLTKKTFPKVNYRISAVHGSVMCASKNDVNDIFGATVNKCSKINRLAKTNGFIISDVMYEKIKNEKKYKIEEIKQQIPIEYGYYVYHISGV